MQKTAIDLVSFATTATVEALMHALDAREWNLRPHTAPSSLRAVRGANTAPDNPTPATPLILLIGDQPCDTSCLEQLMRQQRGAVLGVFASDVAAWDRKVLHYCTDFVRWPCSRDELGYRLRRMLSNDVAASVEDASADELASLDLASLNMIGRAPNFLRALTAIRRIAACDAPVLIQGETGTGKELAARAVHYFSERRDYPFIPVNCGALPDSLIENELFGHERGAFTDAKQASAGLIAQAEGGSLFLDEIDTLSAKAQIALLRFLQDRQYRAVGGSVTRQANVRVIAAANADLKLAVAAKQFREDLLFRIDVLSIALPPLRERADDAAMLARHFLASYSEQYARRKRFHPDTLTWIARQAWPGNVRQLQNTVHRAFLLAEGDIVSLHETDPITERRRSGSDRRRQQDFVDGFGAGKGRAIAEFERAFADWALRESNGNVSAAARRAGKERRAFGKLLKKYGIDTQRYRRHDDHDLGNS